MPIIATASTICGSSTTPAAGRWRAMRAAQTLDLLKRRFGYAFEGKGGYPAVVAAHLLPNHINLAGLSVRAVDQPHGADHQRRPALRRGRRRDRLFDRFRQLDRRHGDAVRRARSVGGRRAAAQAASRPIPISPRRSNGFAGWRRSALSSPIWTTAWTIARSAPSCRTGSSPAMTGWRSSCERRRPGP